VVLLGSVDVDRNTNNHKIVEWDFHEIELAMIALTVDSMLDYRNHNSFHTSV
jgi:hypothetical protein